MPRICEVDGCNNPHCSRGYCSKHLQRFYKYGDPEMLVGRHSTPGGLCIIDGCDNKHDAKGYCRKHYERLRRNGSPHKANKYIFGRLCSVEGCGRKHAAKGYCTKHYHRHLRQTNMQFRIKDNLRRRINSAIKNNRKAASAVRDLGCSIHKFVLYIETQFEDGMSWENWGIHGWHLDHIVPLASFDLTNREQFLDAVHYTNYQPLWAFDNLSKGDRI